MKAAYALQCFLYLHRIMCHIFTCSLRCCLLCPQPALKLSQHCESFTIYTHSHTLCTFLVNVSLYCLCFWNIAFLCSTSTFIHFHFTSIIHSGSSLSKMITCSQDFYLDNSTGLCRPECGKWDQYSPSTRAAVYGVNITFASLIIAVSMATLVLSGIRHKLM